MMVAQQNLANRHDDVTTFRAPGPFLHAQSKDSPLDAMFYQPRTTMPKTTGEVGGLSNSLRQVWKHAGEVRVG